MNYNKIPAELRRYKQWVVWKYEDTGGDKPTKVPYNIDGIRKASVNNPDHWSTFEQVVSAASTGSFAGIGFVLTRDDPFVFIDLDDHEGDEKTLERQKFVYSSIKTYAERSPSGKGLHLIAYGSVASGRKRSQIEIYSSQRFMTMTGDVYEGRDTIQAAGDFLQVLWEKMGAEASIFIVEDKPATMSDEKILEVMFGAENGDLAKDLYEGRWQERNYSSQSEADFALIDIIAFYSKNRFQIMRMFYASALGQRRKARRNDYVTRMVNRAFDRMLPPLDLEGLQNKINDMISRNQSEPAVMAVNSYGGDAAQLALPIADSTPQQSIIFPPGLLGQIADFIYSSAPRPVPEIALAGAIGLMAGICGRAYNVYGNGLNMYVLLIAPTGTGKEAAKTGVRRLMSYVYPTIPSAREYLGPGEIKSAPALQRHLATPADKGGSRCFLSIIGEIGLLLKIMTHEKASPHHVDLRRAFVDLYTSSGFGQMMPPMIYSDREKNTGYVEWPAFSLMGETTPETYYQTLSEDLVKDGFLPRLFTIEYSGRRPALAETNINRPPDNRVVEALKNLCQAATAIQANNTVINVGFDDEALEINRKFDKFCDARINEAPREYVRHMWSRAHVKAMKLAALASVGISLNNPQITKPAMEWAINLVVEDTKRILNKFERGEVGETNYEVECVEKLAELVLAYYTKDYGELAKYRDVKPALHQAKIIPHSYLTMRCYQLAAFKKAKPNLAGAFNNAINALITAGVLKVVSVDQLKPFGFQGKAYIAAEDPSIYLKRIR